MGEMGPIKGKEGKSLTDNNTKIVLHEFLKTVMNKSKPEGQEKKILLLFPETGTI